MADWPLPGLDLTDLVFAGSFASALQTDVPALYPVAIDGVPFKVEVNQVRRRTLDALRTASFQGSTPGEASLSTEAAWLRSQRTWRYGAGLVVTDSPDEGTDNVILNQRFLDSWNLEPDDSGEGMAMMRRASTTTAMTATPQFTGRAVSVGTSTYVLNNNGVTKIETSGATACTGLPNSVLALGSDGYTVWAAVFVDATHLAFYSLTYAGTVFAAMSAGSQVVPNTALGASLFYGNGFLLLSLGLGLYSISSAGAVGTVIDTISTVSASTSAFIHSITCSGQFFYVAISTASVSNLPYPVFKIGVDTTGAFTKFTSAMPSLGPSENVGPIIVDSPFMLVGTNLGFRVAGIGSDGNLSIGPLVRLRDTEGVADAPYFGVTAFGRFQGKMLASFSLGTFSERFADGTSTTFYNNVSQLQCGLLVIDLGRFSDDGVPAWWFWWRDSTDQSPTTTRCVLGENQYNPVVFQTGRYVILGTANLISPASVITPWYTFGLDANKTFVDLEFFHDALATGDTITLYYQADDDTTWWQVGTSNIVGSYSINTPVPLSINARRVRFGFVLAAGSVAQSTTPRLRRFQLRAFATPPRTEEILLPLIVHDTIRIGEDERTDAVLDTRAAYDFLKALVQEGRPVYYQEGDRTYLVKVDKLELQPDHWSIDAGTGNYHFYQGYIITRLLTL